MGPNSNNIKILQIFYPNLTKLGQARGLPQALSLKILCPYGQNKIQIKYIG
jgi:hypothetical protein